MWHVKSVSFMAKVYKGMRRDEMLCFLLAGTRVERRKHMKWGLSKSEYPNDVYPDYCAGMYYFADHSIVSQLISALPLEKFFWVDDVLILGHVRLHTHVKVREIKHVIGEQVGGVARCNCFLEMEQSYQ